MGIGVNLLWGQGGRQYFGLWWPFPDIFFFIVTLSFNDVFEKQKVYGRRR